MKAISGIVILMTVGVMTWFVPAPIVAQADDPFIGTWVLDLARSTYGGTMSLYGATRPAKRVMRFEKLADGIRHVVDTVNSNDDLADSWSVRYTFKIDGREYPADPQMPVSSVAFVRVDDRTIERRGRYQGTIIETVVYSLSADGRTLTATLTGTPSDAAGRKLDTVTSVQVFTRQASTSASITAGTESSLAVRGCPSCSVGEHWQIGLNQPFG